MIIITKYSYEELISGQEKALYELKSIDANLGEIRKLISIVINDAALRKRCKNELPQILKCIQKITELCEEALHFFSKGLPINIEENHNTIIASSNYNYYWSKIHSAKKEIIDLENKINAVNQRISRPKQVDTTTCPVCKGSGGIRECYRCFGKGTVCSDA